ncbi:hypothetical protein [uncultured Enterobacter sp.]|uniref:hypothetical protein n=1 Tax=uncultured Enterobacter sp. TaxID=238202 RepID=UPI00258F2F2A|nr:hypothetical protein [uncultured Enterobacter sp.]
MLDFIRDIFNSFRQTSLDRVKSPFLGAFVFSWVAFNWQAIIILMFSDKAIEKRLASVNENYDIGSFLLGPICTSILIAFLLPQINKIITKIQDKPNSDTIELTLSSKIKIAKLHQIIAELEAKKKLADKREEKNIDANIDAIKEENIKLKDNIGACDKEILDLKSALSDSKIEENNYKAQLSTAIESRDKIESTLQKVNEANLSLNIQLRETIERNSNSEATVIALNNEIDWQRNDKKRLEEIVKNYSTQIFTLHNKFPNIFKNSLIDGIPQIELTDEAKAALPKIDTDISYGVINRIFNIKDK